MRSLITSIGLYAGAVLLGSFAQAGANTLVNTIGSDTFGSGSFSGISQATGQSVAMEFAVGDDSRITRVEAYIFGNGTNQIQLGLMPATGPDGLPSGTFVPGDVQNVSLSNNVPVDLTSLNWVVTTGPGSPNPYWLVAVANPLGFGLWQESPTAFNNWTEGDGTGTESSWLLLQSTGLPPEAIVEGSADAATPLPAALPLFATGLGALGLLGWRRKRKGSASLAAA